MLVLTRKLEEGIVIGEHIKITILEIKDQSVKLGIEAPREVSVHRHEVFAEIKAENQRSRMNDTQRAQQAAQVFKQRKKK